MANIEVPDDAYAAYEAEAQRTGTTVPELVGQVLAHDAGRRRFLTAARGFATAWAPTFAEEFGPVRSGGAAA
ncbi:hypothetical protein ACIA7S_28410 [Streptomyces sp. NPDC051643]|uniref:hypothetical protein n=1 Tax=Streptomyces sp. NPDC051643 TaxID=3365665 RepID=UPI0037BB65E2